MQYSKSFMIQVQAKKAIKYLKVCIFPICMIANDGDSSSNNRVINDVFTTAAAGDIVWIGAAAKGWRVNFVT